MTESEREVRVRAEYAALYPELAADAWVPARTFAEAMVLRARTARGLRLRRRTLDSRHFEFRGGGSEVRPSNAHTRHTDQSGGGSAGQPPTRQEPQGQE
jgi:hypothetical protein